MTEIPKIPHEMVNPRFVVLEAFNRFGEIDSENIPLLEAKRLALEYAMLVSVEHILAGGNTSDLEQRLDNYTHAHTWLGAIDGTNGNDWSLLIRMLRIEAMLVEDEWVSGSKKSVPVIYKICELISASQGSDFEIIG